MTSPTAWRRLRVATRRQRRNDFACTAPLALPAERRRGRSAVPNENQVLWVVADQIRARAEAAAEPPCGTSYNIICTAERNAAKELPGGWRPTLAQSAVRASCFPSALARLRPQALSCQSSWCRAGRSVAFNATPRTREYLVGMRSTRFRGRLGKVVLPTSKIVGSVRSHRWTPRPDPTAFSYEVRILGKTYST